MSINEKNEHTDYLIAKNEYEQIIKNIHSILSKEDKPKTIEERIQNCRVIITELSQNRKVLEKCQKTITEFECKNSILSKISYVFDNTFSNNLNKIDIKQAEVSKLIEKDEHILADLILEELSGDNPNLDDLKRLIDLLMENRPRFRNEKNDIEYFSRKRDDIGFLDLFIKDSANLSTVPIQPGIFPLPADHIDSKIAMLSAKMKLKLLESAKQLSNLYHQFDGKISFNECLLLQKLPKKLNISDLVTPMLHHAEQERSLAIEKLSLAWDKSNIPLWNKIISLPPELILFVLNEEDVEKTVDTLMELLKNQISSEIIYKLLDLKRWDQRNIDAVIKLHKSQIPPKVISEAITMFHSTFSRNFTDYLEMLFGIDPAKKEKLDPNTWCYILPRVEAYLKVHPEHQPTWDYIIDLLFPNVDLITLQSSNRASSLPKSLLMTQSEILRLMGEGATASDIRIEGNASNRVKGNFFFCLAAGLKGSSDHFISTKEDQIELYHLAHFYEVKWLQNKLIDELVKNFDPFEIYEAMDFSDFVSIDLTQKNHFHKRLYEICIDNIASNPKIYSSPQYENLFNLMVKRKDINLFKKLCSSCAKIEDTETRDMAQLKLRSLEQALFTK